MKRSNQRVGGARVHQAGELGEVTVGQKTLLLGDPFKFNMDNMNNFTF